MPTSYSFFSVLARSALLWLGLTMIVSCQPPPKPEVKSVRIEFAQISIQAGSSGLLRGVIDGNELGIQTGLRWEVTAGLGTLTANFGTQVSLVAPSVLANVAETSVRLTSEYDPSQFAVLTIKLIPVVSEIQVSASKLSLLPNQTSQLTAFVSGSGNTDLTWSVEQGSGFLSRVNALRYLFVAPAIREAAIVQIRIASVLDPTQVTRVSLVVRPWRDTVALGALQTFALKQNGSLWAWGSNLYGAVRPSEAVLGSFAPTEIIVSQADSIVALASGTYHGLALSSQGNLWTWGLNSEGQLGLGHKQPVFAPQRVFLGDIVSVSAGEGHSLALLRDGRVFAWGRNTEGQLGVGSFVSHSTPQLIPALSDVVQVSAGTFFSLALLEDGRVMAWGDNRSGQLSLDPAEVALSFTPRRVAGLEDDVVQLQAGGRHVLAVTRQGRVYAWGANEMGQLGDTSTSQRFSPVLLDLEAIVRVVTGQQHSLAQSSSGQIYVWGDNLFGQLGGFEGLMQPNPINSGVVGEAVFAGFSQSGVISSSNELFLFGKNHVGQIKLPSLTAQPVATSVLLAVLLP
jgi:alpha-tubulin suppressor-like RCC1 family protein